MGGFLSAVSPYGGTPGEPTGTSEREVWAYLIDCLRALPQNSRVIQPSVNENDITYALVDELLARRGSRPFYFVPEPPQPKSRKRVDLDARVGDGESVVIKGQNYGPRSTFLELEAKRLTKLEKRREREYLVGEGGGIQRFKQGDHGRRLQVVGMLGYIQRFDASYWQATLNTWIDELIKASPSDLLWDSEDILVLESAPTDHPVTTLRSSPLRKVDGQLGVVGGLASEGVERLTMRHLWVQLCPPN